MSNDTRQIDGAGPDAGSRWTLFFRAESNRIDPTSRPAKYADVFAPRDSDLVDVIALAITNRIVPKGSHRTGVFEVQNDLGIWSHIDGRRIDLSSPRRAAKVIFKSWEQLEAEEEAETAPGKDSAA